MNRAFGPNSVRRASEPILPPELVTRPEGSGSLLSIWAQAIAWRHYVDTLLAPFATLTEIAESFPSIVASALVRSWWSTSTWRR